MTIQLKRNDTKDTISYTLAYANGGVVNLTGASVRFIMGKGNTMITNAVATIVNAATGEVKYTFTDTDTLVAGKFNAEFEVTFSDGKVKTFPNDAYIAVTIHANIDNDQSTYIEDQIAYRVSDIQILKNSIQAQLDQFAIGDSAPEIAQSRVEADGTTNATLKARLDKKEAKFAGDIATLSSSVAQIETEKANKSEVDTQIAAVTSGSPKGTYATLTDLQNAFPTGNTNIYLITADGKWYYWSGSAWTSGGTYQSTGIADSSITSSKLDNLATKRFDYYTKIFKPQNPFINLGVINADNTHTWVGINATLNASDGSNLGVKLPHIKASKALTVSFTNASSSNISLPLINKPAVPAIQGAWFNKADLLAVDGFVRHDFGMFDASNVQISIYPGKNLADTDLIVGSKYTFQTVGSATYTVTTEILAEVNGWYYIASYLDKFPTGVNVVKYKPYIILGGKTVSGTLRVLNPIVVESTDTVTPHKYFNEDEQNLENGSVTTEKYADDSVTPLKLNRIYENLYLDKSKALQGYAAGTTQGGAYVAANWYLSDFIAVKEGDIVQANLARNTAVTNWNASKQIISQYEIGATATSISYTIPAGVSFIRVNIYKDHWADYTLTINGSAVNRLSLSWLNVKQENLDPNISLGGTPVSKWADKAGAALGDSITEYGTYVVKIKAILKLSMYSNWGRAGKPMANGSANGDGINITAMTSVNWSLYDFATIFAGTNDFRLDVPLGTLGAIGDTTFDDTTFYGAYREVIEKALTVKPAIRLCLWTPLQRDNTGYDVNFTNAAGHKLIDYVNAVKEIGKMYGLPVLDMYATSGFTKLTLATFTTDGLHPNEAGDQRIADYASRFLESI
jgi:lysophospholipase L1-like esterase